MNFNEFKCLLKNLKIQAEIFATQSDALKRFNKPWSTNTIFSLTPVKISEKIQIAAYLRLNWSALDFVALGKHALCCGKLTIVQANLIMTLLSGFRNYQWSLLWAEVWSLMQSWLYDTRHNFHVTTRTRISWNDFFFFAKFTSCPRTLFNPLVEVKVWVYCVKVKGRLWSIAFQTKRVSAQPKDTSRRSALFGFHSQFHFLNLLPFYDHFQTFSDLFSRWTSF